MKKTTLLFTLFLTVTVLTAQVPQSFKYQAVARDGNNTVLKNSDLGLKFEIREGSLNGTVVYSETFSVTSNSAGIFSVNIGNGNPTGGNFSDINWGAADHYLNVSIDVNGGTAYEDMGTTQLLSVPYSLYTGSIYVKYSNDTLYIGDQYVIISGENPPPEGTVTDYDGNVYETVTIGSQTWMKQNLRSLHYADGTAIGNVWVYDDNESNAAVWGRLYDWEAAMKGASSGNGNPSGVQGVCPNGWHLPSQAEFNELVSYLGGGAGWKLKDTGSQYWETPNSNTNESGFSAIGAGDKESVSGVFENMKITTEFWTSTENSDTRAYNLILYQNQGGAPMHNNFKENGFSVRCVKD
jgi:uncharacterized protein (TIGR02145 family)